MIDVLLNTTKIQLPLYVRNSYIIKRIIHAQKYLIKFRINWYSLCWRLNKYIKVLIEKLFSICKLEKLECINLYSKQIKKYSQELYFLQRLPELHQFRKCFVMMYEGIRYVKNLTCCVFPDVKTFQMWVMLFYFLLLFLFLFFWRMVLWKHLNMMSYLKLLCKSWRCTLAIAFWKIYEYSFEKAKDVEILNDSSTHTYIL